MKIIYSVMALVTFATGLTVAGCGSDDENNQGNNGAVTSQAYPVNPAFVGTPPQGSIPAGQYYNILTGRTEPCPAYYTLSGNSCLPNSQAPTYPVPSQQFTNSCQAPGVWTYFGCVFTVQPTTTVWPEQQYGPCYYYSSLGPSFNYRPGWVCYYTAGSYSGYYLNQYGFWINLEFGRLYWRSFR